MVGEKSAPRGGLSGAVSLARVPKDARPRSRSSQEVRLQRPGTHGSCHAAGCGRASKCRRAPGAPLGRVPEQQGPRDGPRGVLGEAGFLPLHPSHVAGPDTRGGERWRGRRGRCVHVRAALWGQHHGLPPELPTAGSVPWRPPCAKSPECRLRWKPRGKTGRRNRRRNSTASRGIVQRPIAALGLLPSARHLAVVPGQQPPAG